MIETVKQNILNALTWFYKKIKLNYLDVIREKLDEFITGHADVFLMDDEGNVYEDEDDTGYVYSWDSSVFARRDTVSDVFDRDKDYSAGDYCIYNNTLYKFIADKEKGTWDGDAVEAVNVTDELKEKEEEITQNTSLIKGYTLYENSSGTNGDFTLNDSIANYDYFEVYVKESANYSFSDIFRFYVPPTGAANYCNLVVLYNNTSATNVTYRIALYDFSGTSATLLRANNGSIGSSFSYSADNNIYVYKVIGYKS